MTVKYSSPPSGFPVGEQVLATDIYVAQDVTDVGPGHSNGVMKQYNAGQIRSFIVSNTWINVTSGPVLLVPGLQYKANGTSLISFILPPSSVFGDQFSIEGFGSGLFQINQGIGQSIIFDSSVTTVGPSGSIVSTNRGDGLTIMCMEDNTLFKVRSSIGTLQTI